MLDDIKLEDAIRLSFPIAEKIYNEKIKPIVTSQVTNYFKDKIDKRSFEKESVKYIAWAAGKCSTINTIAYPNTPKKLEDIYVPLTIKSEDDVEIVVDDEAILFESNSKFLVNDSAGMGKSTLSKKIFINVLKKGKYIPVFIELRQLEKKPISEQIALKFGLKENFSKDLIKDLPLVYLFDGLDEVSVDNKEYIIKELRVFIDQLSDPKILITSRKESYLSDFYDFTRYEINSLSEKEAFSLISKYDPKSDVSKKLISGIQQSRDEGLKEFLSTPLYVSLLFCAYRHKTVIPQKKHLFYSQVYEALFEAHDLSKEVGFVRPKFSKLDSSEFHFLLRRLGFWCLKNGGKIEFQKDELEIVVSDIISKANGVKTSAVNFVKDLTTTVPLFIKEGSSIRWSHKSLMEYFSSMFICNDIKENQKVILLHFYHSNNWSTYRNVFELCSDIDFSSMRASVVKEVLSDFVEYHNNNYMDIANKRISFLEVEKRKSFSFVRKLGFKVVADKDYLLNDENFDDKGKDIDVVKEECDESNNEVQQFFSIGRNNEYLIHCIMVSNRESMIVDILSHKCPDLFMKNKKSRGGEVSFREVLSKPSIKKNKLYVVKDNPKFIINNSVYFKAINEMLSIFGQKALDYKKVILELKSIEFDSSNGVDELIGDLL